MIDFTQLSNIKQDKYYKKINSEEIDGRVGEQKVRLISSDGDGFTKVSGDFCYRLKERRYITDITIFFKEKVADLVHVKTKLNFDDSFKTRDKNVSKDESVKHIMVCAFCDEILLQLTSDVDIDSISIYYVLEDDIAEILEDNNDIHNVISEIQQQEERYNSLLSQSEKIDNYIEEQKPLLEEMTNRATTLQLERNQLEDTIVKMEYQLQTKEEIIKERNTQLAQLSGAIKEKNNRISHLNKQIGSYPDSLEGFRSQSKERL